MKPGERALAFVQEHPWAITEAKLSQILAIVESRLSGDRLPDEDLLARYAAVDRPVSRRNGVTQVIPVFGVISQRADLLTMASGGMSTEGLAKAIRGALGDPEVTSIVLNVDSPGGNVFGVQELADEIFRARGNKPIVALANATAASAAYWIASQADELLVTPSGEVGSIGVLAVHDDMSQMAEKAGIKRTFISAGPYKAEGNAFEPLGDEARAFLQERVNGYYDTFVKAVARGRGVAQKAVREGFGQGRMLGADQAVSEGMVDGVATLDEVISRLAAGRKRVMGRVPAASAEAEPVPALNPTPSTIDEIADLRARLAELTR